MAEQYTSDGYPKFWQSFENIRNTTWQSSKKANDFLASIGERNKPGLIGAIQSLSKNGFSWIATALSGLIMVLPGLQSVGLALGVAVQTAGKKSLTKEIEKALSATAKKYTPEKYSKYLTNLLFIPSDEYQDIHSRFWSLNERDRLIVFHHIYNRFSWQYDTILQGNFSLNAETKKTYITCLVLLISVTKNVSDIYHEIYETPKGRAFFAGEGFKYWAVNLTSQDKFSVSNASHLEMLKHIGLYLASMKITHNQTEYDTWAKELQDQIEANQNQKNNSAQTNQTTANNTNLLIGGLGAAKLLGWF